MILSMTGFGRSKSEHKGKSYTIEVKTLNGKQSDIRLKSPNYLRSKEMTLRKLIMDDVMRGKVDFTINISADDGASDYTLNQDLFDNYYKQLSGITQRHGLKNQDFLQTIIRIPNVIQPNDEDITIEEWEYLQSLVQEALADLRSFRSIEGESLKIDLTGRVHQIESLLQSVEGHEVQRNTYVKERITKHLEEVTLPDKIDDNRLEQEIIYYLEKLDIHEEKIRLKQHCEYFKEVINSKTLSVGKKLGFISQEMGREINTLGSKAQYTPLQQIVVEMKVELDQIKEQLANVL